METTLPGMAENPPLAPPVAPVGPGASAAAAAASPAAAVTAPLFGGFRGGRKRKDGLAPGSSEAIEADREKDRLRKERQRSRSVEPPALPAAGAAGVAGQAQAAAGAVGDGAGVEGVPVLAWDAKMLAPLFEQLIPTVEDLTVHQVAVRAAKCRLPPDIVREIEAEAKWSAPARKALELSAPQVAARLLNKTGISAENQPEVIFFTAISAILAGQVMTLKRLDKLAAIANVPTTKPGQPAPGVKPAP